MSEYKDSAALRRCWCSGPKRGLWVTCLSVVTCANIMAEELEGSLASDPTTFIHAWPWQPRLSSQPLHYGSSVAFSPELPNVSDLSGV